MAANDLYVDDEDWSPSRKRIVIAWLTHLVTASSAVWGLLAILAITNQEWVQAFWWMAIAIFIDSFDGLLARRVEVKRVLPQIDGELLDNIVDYLNYVFVPAYFLYAAEMLPPRWAVIGPALILLASAYQFSQTEAKTDNHFFRGFPSYWNVMVFYMFMLDLNPLTNLAWTLFFVVMVFVPFMYIYPSRTTIQPRLMMVFGAIWGLCNLAMLILYPGFPAWIMWLALSYVIYYHALSLYATWKVHQQGENSGV